MTLDDQVQADAVKTIGFSGCKDLAAADAQLGAGGEFAHPLQCGVAGLRSVAVGGVDKPTQVVGEFTIQIFD